MKLKKLIKFLNSNETIAIHVLNKAGHWERNKFYGEVKNISYWLVKREAGVYLDIYLKPLKI